MMMSRDCYSVAAVAAAALLFLPSLLMHCATSQSVHVVGDSTRWRIPSSTNFYSDWASSKTFRLNDVLTFNFPTGAHDIVKVPKTSYDDCRSSNRIGATISIGPANVTLNETGTHYFICSFSTHCAGGQKLSVTVVSGSSTTPATGSPSPSPSSSSTPQPPPPPPTSAAPPALISGSFLVMLSFALAKLVF